MAKKKKDLEYYEGVGRRKEAVARVRLFIINKSNSVTVGSKKLAKGDVVINGKSFDEFFKSDSAKKRFNQPFELTNNSGRFAVSILVAGGGAVGQIEAIAHGISRAIVSADSATYKPLLKQHSLLTRDPRTRERRKVGTGGKARRQKQSPKR